LSWLAISQKVEEKSSQKNKKMKENIKKKKEKERHILYRFAMHIM
jgi:hypothetical protein